MPATNVLVANHRVDAIWEDRRLVVGLDSRAFHGTGAAFERDRRRDADLQVRGYRTVRYTHRRMTRERDEVIAELRQLVRS